MKKVVVYGIYSVELRRKIEHYMDYNKYKIVAYSDSFFSKDILDEKEFISPDNINQVDFDYIVIAILSRETANTVMEDLIKKGIKQSKIIIPQMLYNHKYIYQRDIVKKIDCEVFDEDMLLIFGLSYSLRGIIKENLKYRAFDFSWHGLDLYYNYKLLEYAVSKYDMAIKPKYSILCFSYDYFNYDMSKSVHQYETGQIMAISRLNDYHNADVSNYEINNVINSLDMFAKGFMDFYDVKENIHISHVLAKDEKQTLGHTYTENHTDTISENIQVMDKFILLLKKISEKVIIVIPPIYVGGSEYCGLHEHKR